MWDDFNNWAGAIAGNAGSLLGLISNPTPPDDISVLTLDKFTLPGIVQSEEITKELDVEYVPIEDLSGSVKLIKGHKDARLRYQLTLVNDPVDDGIMGDIGSVLSGDPAALIDKYFGGDKAAPQTAVQKLDTIKWFFNYYTQQSPHHWKIRQELANSKYKTQTISEVIWERMTIGRNSTSDKIEVSAEFTEYKPAVIGFDTGKDQPTSKPPEPSPDTTNAFDDAKKSMGF